MIGGGAYHLAGDRLARLRAAIDDDRTGPSLEGIVADLRAEGAETGAHEPLKTAPRLPEGPPAHRPAAQQGDHRLVGAPAPPLAADRRGP